MQPIAISRPNQPIYWGRARFAHLDTVVLAMGDYIIAQGFLRLDGLKNGAENALAVRDNLLHQLNITDCPMNQPAIDSIMDRPQFCLIGSPYQHRVWLALLQLKPNETTSYKQLAIQCNSHPRPIGGAVGANLLSGFVPCHRVVGSNGNLTGYRWGLAVKESLLAS